MIASEAAAETTSGWDTFVAAHPEGSVYHTTAWARVADEAFGHHAMFLSARGSDGALAGVLPLYKVATVLGRRLVSVPFRDRGGPLTSSPDAVRVLVDEARRVAERERCAYVELRCLRELPLETLPADVIQRQYWTNTVVRLSDTPADLWSELRENARSPVKQARRAGVRTRWGGRDDLPLFHRLFVSTRRRLGVPAYSLRLFRSLWSHLPPGTVRLLLAEHDGRAVAALVLFASGCRLIEAYAASEPAALPLRANDLLVWTAIEAACRDGFKAYDFGADSPEQKGLLAFKRKWRGGAEAVFNYYFVLRGKTPGVFDPAASRHAWSRQVWSHLPTPLFTRLSALTVRQLG